MKTAAFLQDNSTVASVAFNGEITFWDAKLSHKSTIHTAGHRDWFPTLALSPDGTKLVSLGADGSAIFESTAGHPFSTWRPDHLIRLTDVRTGRELSTLEFSGGIEHLTFSPDGKTVVFGSLGEIHLWHTETGDKLIIPLVDWEAQINNIPHFIPHFTGLSRFRRMVRHLSVGPIRGKSRRGML